MNDVDIDENWRVSPVMDVRLNDVKGLPEAIGEGRRKLKALMEKK